MLEKLRVDGRLHDASKEHEERFGIRNYCWLSPAEDFTAQDASATGAEWHNGAFVFCYDDPSCDCLLAFPGGEHDEEAKRKTAKTEKKMEANLAKDEDRIEEG